jgi:hypothetical protein
MIGAICVAPNYAVAFELKSARFMRHQKGRTMANLLKVSATKDLPLNALFPTALSANGQRS